MATSYFTSLRITGILMSTHAINLQIYNFSHLDGISIIHGKL
jgi:hypothetical protein